MTTPAHPLPFPEFLARHRCILGEGAVIERLRRQPGITLDPFLVNSAFVYEPAQREALTAIYRQYLNIGRERDLPLFMSTPTWRANAPNIAAAGLSGRSVNADNVRLLQDLRGSAGAYAAKVVIGGMIGCRGDAYRPEEALEAEEALAFHAWQADRLAEAGVDFLLGITLPALSEARGLAAAMAGTGRPYVLSFVARPNGTLLDGTPLVEAVATIDALVRPGPTAYLINCTHPDFARAALTHADQAAPEVRRRFIGLLANTAALSPEELDGREHLVGEEPERFAEAMIGMRRDFGLQVLGGCCGTDDQHIRCLADRLRQE